MQIKSLRIKSYRSWCIDDSSNCPTAKKRLSKIKSYQALRSEGCSEKVALDALNTSRATMYRWMSSYKRYGVKGLEPKSKAPRHKRVPQWSKQLEQQILHLRRQFPLWGKKTLTTILCRERHVTVSESTVGRILKKLIHLGKIKPVSFYYGRLKDKRVRRFNKHAKRWKKGMKASKPGELIQIDHMTVAVSAAGSFKHFKATCPVTKVTVAQIYTTATSRAAARFLEYVRLKLPFKIISIQVDGGSEFKKEFEATCEKENIPLFVLPPRSPELNGCVERCNRTLRYEFYRFYDGLLDWKAIREALKGYMELYNTFRPHQSLKQATPMEYYQRHFAKAA